MTAPIASGREADIFALDDRRVLRRYRRVTDVSGEAKVMTYVAGLGYPVPAVYEANGSDMVLERLDGPTMAEALAAGDIGIPAGAGILANLLQTLHELPTWPGAEQQIVHLDLHPENVMLTGRGPVVIDWCNATDGAADLDTALTAVILAQVAIDGAHPWSAAADRFLDAFLAVAPGDPNRLLDDAVAFRGSQLSLTGPDALAGAKARIRGAA
ncbi:MAG TPA: phosphotransferase [Actinoplanes sp.]|nr:phosphotransferase [Actinoplanes sp.]